MLDSSGIRLITGILCAVLGLILLHYSDKSTGWFVLGIGVGLTASIAADLFDNN